VIYDLDKCNKWKRHLAYAYEGYAKQMFEGISGCCVTFTQRVCLDEWDFEISWNSFEFLSFQNFLFG
jgi:hypothetical protein